MESPGWAVFGWAFLQSLPVIDKYRSVYSQPSIRQSTGSPVKELEKVPKKLKRFAAPWEEQQYELPSISRAPWD